MYKYALLLFSLVLLTSRISHAQVRRGTGLVRPNYQYSEVQLHAYTGRLAIKPESREQFLQATRTIAQLARKEAGCQSFYYYEDADTPSTFLLTSTWTSRSALDTHLAATYLVDYLDRLPHWLATPSPLTFYDILKARTTMLQVSK
ncbi:MAG: antibiotic biosynthesis monooxygenase [Hymenobacter sp.]|jgi:quinol monooxygenase YgiN|nr:MAG: antibiotic biosynthesis monooxygenase [Hymenobacter sp.]